MENIVIRHSLVLILDNCLNRFTAISISRWRIRGISNFDEVSDPGRLWVKEYSPCLYFLTEALLIDDVFGNTVPRRIKFEHMA